MRYLIPQNWRSFQHYKHRTPPWVKLHRSLLDDYEYHCLHVASKALAPLLWLIASEFDECRIPFDEKLLAFRLRITEQEFSDAVNGLISQGFFFVVDDASSALADCKQDNPLEKSRDRVETETEVAVANATTPPLVASNAQKQIEFSTTEGIFKNVSSEVIDRWEEAFPKLDIDAELNRAEAWYAANPRKRKKNHHAFLTNWLARSHDRINAPPPVRMAAKSIAGGGVKKSEAQPL